jgi:hypothetical protein
MGFALAKKVDEVPHQMGTTKTHPAIDTVTASKFEIQKRKRDSNDQIIFGPWAGELGMEIFYWAPWVYSVARKHDLVISRGGTGFLYPNQSKYIDMFTYSKAEWWAQYQSDQVKVYGGEKQRLWLPLEFDFIRQLQRENVLSAKERMIHPKEYFKTFYPDATQDEERITEYVKSVESHLPLIIEQNLLRMNKNQSIHFDGTQIAYGVYSREGVDESHVSRFLRSSRIKEIVSNSEVFSLKTSYSDKHHLQLGVPENISYPLIDSQRDENLLNQATIIANCKYLITTHGGLAYLGLLLGKNVIALQGSIDVWHPRHVKNAQMMARLQNVNFEVVIY